MIEQFGDIALAQRQGIGRIVELRRRARSGQDRLAVAGISCMMPCAPATEVAPFWKRLSMRAKASTSGIVDVIAVFRLIGRHREKPGQQKPVRHAGLAGAQFDIGHAEIARQRRHGGIERFIVVDKGAIEFGADIVRLAHLPQRHGAVRRRHRHQRGEIGLIAGRDRKNRSGCPCPACVRRSGHRRWALPWRRLRAGSPPSAVRRLHMGARRPEGGLGAKLCLAPPPFCASFSRCAAASAQRPRR